MNCCFWCNQGWPKPIADIYTKALSELGGDRDLLKYGPSHIVWADENFEDSHILSCLRHIFNDEYCENHTPEQLIIISRSLIDLSAVPEELRIEPENWDDMQEGDFSPTVEMVRVT